MSGLYEVAGCIVAILQCHSRCQPRTGAPSACEKKRNIVCHGCPRPMPLLIATSHSGLIPSEYPFPATPGYSIFILPVDVAYLPITIEGTNGNRMEFIIWIISSLLGATWRVTIHDPHHLNLFDDISAKRIYCIWHKNLLALSYIFRNTGKTAIVSKSNDGRIAAAVAQKWNYAIISGSSSRGASSALREALRVLAAKRCVAVTPDGPRGPKEKVKTGVAQMSIYAGAAAVAVNLSVDRAWRLKSWDGFIIPKPFASLKVTLAEPLVPTAGDRSDATVESFRQSIEASLSAV